VNNSYGFPKKLKPTKREVHNISITYKVLLIVCQKPLQFLLRNGLELQDAKHRTSYLNRKEEEDEGVIGLILEKKRKELLSIAFLVRRGKEEE